MKTDNTNPTAASVDVEALTSTARAILVGPMHEQLVHGERAIRLRLARERAPHSPWGWRLGLAATACIVLLVAGTVWLQGTQGALLQYRLENATLTPDLRVLTSGTQSPVLRFSDGTEIRLEPTTKARIRFLTEHGATLAMDEGNLHAEVVHSNKSEWRFDVGPYVVHVTGTAFGLSWAPNEDRFDLKLEHGSVTVHAPVSNGPIPVRAGQWLTIRSKSNEVLIRDLTTAADLAPGLPSAQPSLAPSIAIPSNAPPATVTAGTSQRELDPPRSWVKELRLGRLEQIVADAQQRGLDTCINTVSSEELSALADAARYTRRNDIARSALNAQRRRFAGSNKSSESTFLLGKLAEAERDATGALKYFNSYLQESPGGRYAGEALGRKMAIVQQSAGSATAKPIAEQYLSKYPTGTYAEAARAILNGP